MQLGITIGHATSTIKHPSLQGWRMAVVQPLGVSGGPEGDPVIAVDKWSSGLGQRVVLNTDGKAAREMIGDNKSPVRFFVIAIVDEVAGAKQQPLAGR